MPGGVSCGDEPPTAGVGFGAPRGSNDGPKRFCHFVREKTVAFAVGGVNQTRTPKHVYKFIRRVWGVGVSCVFGLVKVLGVVILTPVPETPKSLVEIVYDFPSPPGDSSHGIGELQWGSLVGAYNRKSGEGPKRRFARPDSRVCRVGGELVVDAGSGASYVSKVRDVKV